MYYATLKVYKTEWTPELERQAFESALGKSDSSQGVADYEGVG